MAEHLLGTVVYVEALADGRVLLGLPTRVSLHGFCIFFRYANFCSGSDGTCA